MSTNLEARRSSIRGHSELNEVPIIAVTSFDAYGIREAALEAGCRDYLLMPLEPGALELALRGALPGFDFARAESVDSSRGAK